MSRAEHIFPSGGSGAGLAAVAPFSLTTNYAKGDPVRWLGSTFVAKNAIAAGASTNPLTDTANWSLVAQGGGQIAYAENVTNQITGAIAAATQFDIPGCSIIVPANSGNVVVEGRLPMVAIQVNAGALVGELVQVYGNITDEAGNIIAQDTWQYPNPIATAGKNAWRSMLPKRRIPNRTTDKTYKLGLYTPSLVSGHYTISAWAGPGTQTSQGNGVANFDFTPAYITATSV